MNELYDSRPMLHPNAAVERVGGRVMVATGDDRLHVFTHDDDAPSEVGERILALADGARTVRDIALALCGEFDVLPDEALAETASFVRALLERQVFSLSPHSGRALGEASR